MKKEKYSKLDKYEAEIEASAMKHGIKESREDLSKYIKAAKATIKKRALDMKTIREKELSLSQKELSELLGVKKRTLERWDAGRSEMPRPVHLWMKLLKEKPSIKNWLENQAVISS
jgi:DNA-binding transcriptional regulator YiaG